MLRDITRQQQGWQANQNGAFWRKDIANRLIQHHYAEAKQIGENLFQQPYFVQQVSGKFRDMFDAPWTVDFYVEHPEKLYEGLIIEAKYQEAHGSADHKLPYVVFSLKATKMRSMLFLFGDGIRLKVKNWCVDQQDDQLAVLTGWDEWVRLFNRGAL